MKMPPRLATFVPNIPVSRSPGSFRYFSLADGSPPFVGGMIFRCAGCGEVRTVGFVRPTLPGAGTWKWDGNRHEPTLSPGLAHGCGWQGALRRGVWET